ncbi:hypothetical protein ACHAWT_008704 [Skeletonema menzelii]
MKFTITLPLFCLWFAAAGPAAADVAALRKLDKASKIEDDAASLNRRVQEDVEVEDVAVAPGMKVKETESCASEYFNVGLQQAFASKEVAQLVWWMLFGGSGGPVGPGFKFGSVFGSVFGALGVDASPTTEEAIYSAAPLTNKDLRGALRRFPTLDVLHDAVRGNPGDLTSVRKFAADIDHLFAGMDCKEFSEFLNAGEPFRQAIRV